MGLVPRIEKSKKVSTFSQKSNFFEVTFRRLKFFILPQFIN